MVWCTCAVVGGGISLRLWIWEKCRAKDGVLYERWYIEMEFTEEFPSIHGDKRYRHLIRWCLNRKQHFGDPYRRRQELVWWSLRGNGLHF